MCGRISTRPCDSQRAAGRGVVWPSFWTMKAVGGIPRDGRAQITIRLGRQTAGCRIAGCRAQCAEPARGFGSGQDEEGKGSDKRSRNVGDTPTRSSICVGGSGDGGGVGGIEGGGGGAGTGRGRGRGRGWEKRWFPGRRCRLILWPGFCAAVHTLRPGRAWAWAWAGTLGRGQGQGQGCLLFSPGPIVRRV